MIRVLSRRSNDVSYFTDDRALEIEGLRDGEPGWWLRGAGDSGDPRCVAEVLRTSQRSSILGYDIVVAAPRPTSILLAIDAEHGSGVVAAHRTSVGAAIDYLEEHALVVRDRRGGEDRDQAGRWTGIVGFTHGVNRHGEPHLHDHVLVGALPEGSRSVLDSRGLFAHLEAADALYRTSLRHELKERTSWSAWRSFEVSNTSSVSMRDIGRSGEVITRTGVRNCTGDAVTRSSSGVMTAPDSIPSA